MASIYHFFKTLISKRGRLEEINDLEEIAYDETVCSCKSKGKFPDLAICINRDDDIFTGGELIEIKDSQSYGISSFNSTIPTGKKNIADVTMGESSDIRRQMEAFGDDVYSLPVRDVFYLIRGRNGNRVKICLVHGSFFETIPLQQLITGSFGQVLKERLEQTGESLTDEVRDKIVTLFSIQSSFSKVRNILQASVKLRFRVMTEVKPEANILNPTQYPEILDDTLNLILPRDDEESEKAIQNRLQHIFTPDELTTLKTFKTKHHLNGYFFVVQMSLSQK